MRRVLVLATILLITMLTAIPAAYVSPIHTQGMKDHVILGDDISNSASAGGAGNDTTTELFMSRKFTNNLTRVNNTYGWPTNHNNSIDLTQYHIPGWTLYQADIGANTITAVNEKESIGFPAALPADQLLFNIDEYTSGYYYAMLAQGFYNQAHDGKLENYSVPYVTLNYNTGTRGTSYMLIVSDYTDNSTGLTTPAAMAEHGSGWEYMTVSGESIILGASTTYYVYMNGSELYPDAIFSIYPEIYWRNQDSAGTYTTARWSTEFMAWSSPSLEGLVWYSYTPWNQTSNSALEFAGATDIGLNLNTTPATGLEWTVRSAKNITSILIETAQSVEINYNLTLWYKQEAAANTLWDVQSSGSLIDWNVTTTTTYPSLTGTIEKFLNVSVPLDWTPTGVYNSSNPSTNFTNYVSTIGISKLNVSCFSMTDGLWTLTFTGLNYVTDIRLYDSLDSSNIWTESSIFVDLDIDVRIEDGSSVNVTTGNTNLTVIHEASTVYAPLLDGPEGLGSSFLWDISAASDNGTFFIEVFWTDGSEAGYLVKQLTVFYETTLTPDDYSLSANTDSTFDISVFLENTFDSSGIFDPNAAVTYSFLSAVNVSLTDHANGTWTATIDTTGEASGTSTLTVYAEGSAIENRSVDITVTLTHQTSLQLDWSSTSFDWTESTNFSVDYIWDRGPSLIANADQLDVDIDGSPYTLLGTNGTYWIELNFTFDLGVHSIFVNITEPGYDPASDTATFTITEAITVMTVTWEPANVTIDYTEMFNLTVDYTHTGIDVPATATVNVTIDGSTYDLSYSGTEWVVSIAGPVLGPGVYDADISAWLYGYEARLNTTFNLNVTIAAGQLIVTPSWSENNTDYVSTIILQIDVDYPNGSGVIDAVVSADISGVPYIGIHVGGGIYNITLGPLVPLGVNDVNSTVTRTGWNPFSVISTLTITSTSTVITTSYSDDTIFYDGNIQVDIYYEMWNTTNLVGWTLEFDVEGTVLSSAWVTDHYEVTIQGDSFGVGSFLCNANASLYGFVTATNTTSITINPIPTLVDITGTLSMYVNSTLILSVTYEDGRTSSPLDNDSIVITWPLPYDSWTKIGPGLYELVISSTALHEGTESLQLVIYKVGYADNTTLWDIEILPVPTSINNDALYTQWENETLAVTARLRDTYHASWVHWANLTLTFDGADYSMTYNALSGYYQVNIYLNS
ncbi:MAG: hypothetical protein ACXADC_17145, partial [Candidatus Thorarchaeota archaeon]